jgi:hypothetical protein
MLRRNHFLLALLLVPAALGAQQRPAPCTAGEHRQFDFWIGDWTVTDSAGTKTMGSNRITSEESGCLVHEHWTGAGGGTGQSFNFYNVARKQWEQVWVASVAGGNLHIIGTFDGTAMVLAGERPGPNGATVMNRIRWAPQADGRVRQTWESSNDGGATWTVSFDGWYRKART